MGKILIIEDDALNMRLFNDLLQANGYDTLCAEGDDVLTLIREERPDLILMDVRLSKTSGLELVKTLKSDRELKSIPVVALTTSVMSGDKEQILKSGCDGYISKPLSIDELLDTVSAFMT